MGGSGGAETEAAGNDVTATRKDVEIVSPMPQHTRHDVVEVELDSIYSLWPPRRRWRVLLTVAFAAILLPFSDTIYLPALSSIQEDLNTSEALVAASVAIYLVAVGVFSLLWGPFSDYYGRRMTYIVTSLAFTACSIVCVFAPDIGLLIAFRALQGAFVAAFLAAGTGALSDVFTPATRGFASGIFMVPLLVGPILGPVVGGALTQVLGWRSTFVALAILAFLNLVAVLLLLEESHQYIVLQRLSKEHPERASQLFKLHGIAAPVFHPPWVPLMYWLKPGTAPHAAAVVVCFSAMFMSLIALPTALAISPYSLDPGMIGVTFLANGVASFICSVIGGKLADVFAAKFPQHPEGRLLPAVVALLLTTPPGCLVFGWTLEYGSPLAVPLIGVFLLGMAPGFALPAMFSYLANLHNEKAGAAIGAVQFGMFIASGVSVLVIVPVVNAIGLGAAFSIMAGVSLATVLCSGAVVARQMLRGGLPVAKGTS